MKLLTQIKVKLFFGEHIYINTNIMKPKKLYMVKQLSICQATSNEK